MLEEGKNILKYSPGDKSLKAPFIIYADLECLLKKEQPRQNNSENCFNLSLICSFDETKNRRKSYRRKYCIGKFCEGLKELATDIINYKEKEMIPLAYNKIKSYEKKACHICKEGFCYDKNKKSEYHLYHKVRDHCH